MQTPAIRAVLGFIAAAISVLTFHQAMWEALHLLALPGMGMPAPYPTDPIAPFGVPRILNLCFWGGLYGIVFALVLPRLSAPMWLSGLILGIIAALVGLLVVPAIKGLPVGPGFPLNWVRSLLINGCWGLGVGIILPLLMRRQPRLA
jgi:xanthosine utilization system XapX-like protein